MAGKQHVVAPATGKKKHTPRSIASSQLEQDVKTSPLPLWRRPWVILLLILVIGAFLRLVDLTKTPPGLNQDEATNAWGAYCILKTGQDQFGVRWPIFTQCFGMKGRSTLYMYLLFPFQIIGGLSVLTTRLPSAVGGIITLPLIYYVGRRLFGQSVGLVAAGLMALNPWHIQQSRWGLEGGIVPLLTIGPMAAWLWANLPLDAEGNRRPSAWRAILAGAITGIGCYGYPAARLFLPAFFPLAILVTWGAWIKSLKTRDGILACAGLVFAGAATFSPLVWIHLRDAEIIKRGATTWIWQPSDPMSVKLQNVLTRYAEHFGPDFLFLRGDHSDIQSPPKMGMFHWYMLPLMLLGLVASIKRLPSSGAARILLLWFILYPIGDSLNAHISLHAMRSLPGPGGLILLAALGAVTTAVWLDRRNRMAALAAGGVLAIAIVGLNARFMVNYFGDYKRTDSIYHRYHTDLVEAAEWLKPRWNSVDAVFCTTASFNQPFAILLVGLGYDPHQWFKDVRDIEPSGDWDIHTRVGKMHFMYDASRVNAALKELRENDRPDHVVFLIRPGELRGLPKPVHEIRRPDGQVVLWICETDL